MNARRNQIDLLKLTIYILKRIWLVVICAIIGFAGMYWYTTKNHVDTYTASGTMYIYNGNPNVVNYQYTNISDLNSAVQLLDTYTVVVKSSKVLDVVAERLVPDYPNISTSMIAGSISMNSVLETGVVRVSCVTRDPQMSADICNAVMDVAPAEIIRVVSAGNIEVIDYAVAPMRADPFLPQRRSLRGALVGGAAALALLALLFLLNQKVTDAKDLREHYTPPVLASVKRSKQDSKDPSSFMLNDKSPMETVESYAKLRMNLLYTLVGKEHHSVVITSSVSSEGKSTISANLAISCAMSGKRVILIDGDMRRACQRDIFHYHRNAKGLTDILVGNAEWKEAVRKTDWDTLDLLPAGQTPPNPAELLSSAEMKELLDRLEDNYDLVLIDMPPIDIVSDPLVISSQVAGCLFVARQNFTDHREVRKSLNAAEMTGMNVLGFVFYGENVEEGRYYYSRKYYKNYYHKYDTRETANHLNQEQ